MKSHAFPTLFALCLSTLLAACGSGTQVDTPDQQIATAAQANVAAQVSTATMPAPDCAADGCKGLRVIDANAEAYRYAAQQRAGAAQS